MFRDTASRTHVRYWIGWAPALAVAIAALAGALATGRSDLLGWSLLAASLWPWCAWALVRRWPGLRIRALSGRTRWAWSTLLLLGGSGLTLWISGTTFDDWWRTGLGDLIDYLLEVMRAVETWKAGLGEAE